MARVAGCGVGWGCAFVLAAVVVAVVVEASVERLVAAPLPTPAEPQPTPAVPTYNDVLTLRMSATGTYEFDGDARLLANNCSDRRPVAFLINLDKDVWRLRRSVVEMRLWLRLVRVPAIPATPGHLGLYKTYWALLEFLARHSLPMALLVEDDVALRAPAEFARQWRPVCDALQAQLDSWDMFNGGMFGYGRAVALRDAPAPTRLVEVRGGWGTHLVALSVARLRTRLPAPELVDPAVIGEALFEYFHVDNVVTAVGGVKLSALPFLADQRPMWGSARHGTTDYGELQRKLEAALWQDVTALLERDHNRVVGAAGVEEETEEGKDV